MSQPPPLPQSQFSTPPPLPRKFRWGRFFLAFAIGVVISAICWIGGWEAINKGDLGALIIIIPLLKIITATIMVCFRQTRSAAIGLYASIPVGFGIFFTACVGSLTFH
jgi:hypothetical protein